MCLNRGKRVGWGRGRGGGKGVVETMAGEGREVGGKMGETVEGKGGAVARGGVGEVASTDCSARVVTTLCTNGPDSFAASGHVSTATMGVSIVPTLIDCRMMGWWRDDGKRHAWQEDRTAGW